MPYTVGYTPLTIGGERVGVVAISTIYRQRDIDEEVADRNVGVFGIYAAVLVAALAAGGLLAARIAGPIRELSSAAGEVGRGRFDVELPYAGSDEIGELTGAFRNMAAELARSRSELAAAERERAWREMAKQVAHEIRNPLTPIKLSVQHLRQAFRDGAADREQLLQRVTETVLDQIDVLSRIATEFSHFARMPDARYERAHLGRLLDEAVAIFAEVDGIRFERSTGELPVTLLADREQLRRVFINMFRNSIQAMPGGGTILLETSVEERTVVLRVTDNGPGIPPEVLSRVFEPNFSTKSEGMGLGLAIAKKVIEDHGGTIRCESAVGHGTSFEIRLPLVA